MGDAATGLTPPPPAAAMLDRFFEAFYRRRPVTATFTGRHEHDRRLPDWSLAGLAAEADEMRSLRAGVAAARLGQAAGVVPAFADGVDLELADAHLEIALAEHDSGHFVHRNPSLWTGEAIFGVLSLVTRDFAPLSDRLESARQRLEAMPAFLEPARKIIQEAPLDWKGRARRECQAAAKLFGETLPAWVETEVPASGAAWTIASRRAVRAFEAFDAWLGPIGQPTLLPAFRSSMPRRAVRARVGRPRSAGPAADPRPLRHHADRRPAARGHRRARRIHGPARRDVAATRRLARGAGAAGRRSRPGRRVSCLSRTEVARLQGRLRRARPGHLARRAAALRAVPGAHPRRRAPSLLPALPLPGAVRSLRHVRLRRPADRWSATRGRRDPAARDEPQRDDAQPRGAPWRHRAPRAEPPCLPRCLTDRPGGGGRCRQPDRDVHRRQPGRGLGLLRRAT